MKKSAKTFSSKKIIIKDLSILLFVLLPLGGYLSYCLYIEGFAPLEKQPYVQWSGLDPKTQVFIAWETAELESSYVQLGTSPLNLNIKFTNTTTVKMHQMLIDLPFPNTKYYYQVGANDVELFSGVQSFTNAPDTVIPFNFTLISDTQAMWGTGHFNTIASAIGNAGDMSFVAFAGDMVQEHGNERPGEDDATPTVKQNTYNLFMEYSSRFSDTIPIVPGMGNHDGDSIDGVLYEKYFNVPNYNESSLPDVEKKKAYFAFNWSNVQFISCQVADGGDNDPAQPYNLEHDQWLNKTLKNGQSQDFRIIMFHRALYSSNGNNQQLIDRFMPIVRDYNVSLVLYGHEHIYERYEVEGHVLLCQGSGGGLQNMFSRSQPELKIAAMGASYTRLFFNGEDYDLMIRTLSPTNDIIDEVKYDLEKSNIVEQEVVRI